jgi:hypothetical protein
VGEDSLEASTLKVVTSYSPSDEVCSALGFCDEAQGGHIFGLNGLQMGGGEGGGECGSVVGLLSYGLAHVLPSVSYEQD